MSFVEVNEKKLHYKLLNEKLLMPHIPVLVFLHEGLGSIEQWKQFPEILSNELSLPALVYDRYGYGKSEGFNEERTIDYIEEEANVFLPGIIKKLELDNPLILIGHSDGGSIALVYAGQHARVASVITMAAHVFIEDVSREGIKKAIDAFENDGLIEKLNKHHGENTQSMFYGWANTWLSEESKEWNLEKYLPGIKCPVMVIQGVDDGYGTFAQVESIATNCGSGAEMVYLEDCGHIPHFQQTDIVKEKIIDFIRTLRV